MIDCTSARLLWLLQRRDAQELDDGALGELEAHLELCADCVAWSRQECRVDEALGGAVRAVAVPQGLAGRLHDRLQRERPRRRLPWVAAAALLLSLTAIGLHFWLTDQPPLYLDDFSMVAIDSKSAETVEAWFEAEGVAIVAPRDFNYDLLSTPVGFAIVKGRRVPRLEFFHPGDDKHRAAVAHVYIVDEARFQVEQLAEEIPSPVPHGPHHTALVQRREGFSYVIFYTGGALRPFLVQHGELVQ